MQPILLTPVKSISVAVTYENGEVFQHFGRTENFKIYRIKDGKVADSEVVSSNGAAHGALIGVLKAHNVDALICGGIGGGAKNLTESNGMKLYPGVSGNADEAVKALINGNLDFDPNTECKEHHDHDHHHGDGHGCTCGK